MRNRYIAVREYDKITYDIIKENGGSDKTFKLLKQFVEDNNNLMYFSRRGEVSATSYVGIIELADGFVIEILPKISHIETDKLRDIFLRMIRRLPSIRSRYTDFAKLRTDRMSLFEVFANMFVDEIALIVKVGLKNDYVLCQDNEVFLKGKILWGDHLRYNLVHKERFYVEYDVYSENNAANRIIKTALEYLYKKDFSTETKKRIRQHLFIFDDIDVSHNLKRDFLSVESKGRLFNYYKRAIDWAKVFLRRETFINQKGKDVANAILFPMEEVFEGYMTYVFKRYFSDKYIVKPQHFQYYLVDEPKKFKMRPDIVLQDRTTEEIIIVDMKWKVLSDEEENNFGISQGDMYQLFAYGMKYKEKEKENKVERLYLVYPENEKFNIPKTYKFSEGMTLTALPVDLRREESVVDDLRRKLN